MPISDLGGMERGSRLTMAMNFGHLANKGGGVPPQIGYCLLDLTVIPLSLLTLMNCHYVSFLSFFSFNLNVYNQHLLQHQCAIVMGVYRVDVLIFSPCQAQCFDVR